MQHILSQPRGFAPLIELDLFVDVHSVPPGPEPGLDVPRQRICRMCAAEVLLYGLKDWWIRERKKGLLDATIAERPDCPDGTTCRRQKEHGKFFFSLNLLRLGTRAYSFDVFQCTQGSVRHILVFISRIRFPAFPLTGALFIKTVNHVFDSAAEALPEPSTAASTSISSSVVTEADGGGSGGHAAAPAQPFSSLSQASRHGGGVRSHPSLDSEAMVDAALSNMIHDVDELPSLPPLSDLMSGPPTHAHTHAHAHAHHAHPTLDIFDAF